MKLEHRPIILLDRDGTINVDRHYLSDPDALEFEVGAVEGLRDLAAMNALLCVVTNQSGVARGMFGLERVEAVNQRLASMLHDNGVEIAGWYVCPHGPDDGCNCRKPEPGLALQAAAEHGFDPAAVIVVGDKLSDVGLAESIGGRGILVRSGLQVNDVPSELRLMNDIEIISDLRQLALLVHQGLGAILNQRTET